ncbi:hypothetical protein H4S14_000269 [Agrobacterium vitis]|nr:hypothetical protein [Agrobacterium vitis]MBE1436542.1 hypothetical protein [Agrobacterium vitis]
MAQRDFAFSTMFFNFHAQSHWIARDIFNLSLQELILRKGVILQNLHIDDALH